MTTTLIENIGQLAPLREGPGPIENDARVDALADAWLSIEDGRILGYGKMSEPQRTEIPVDARRIDARGGAVVPGLVDAHTHLVFSGTREREFVQRAEGNSYLEIARAGGGILNTVRAVRAAPMEALVEAGLERLDRMLEHGVTTVEVKSGYGLTIADELKMLEVVRRLDQTHPITLVPTFLGAHTVPPEFRENRAAYVDLLVSDDCLGRIASEGLAEFCDVFCEESAFDLDESRRILERADALGFGLKIHADQLTQMGASRLAAELGVSSAEHLEHIDDHAIAALRSRGVIAGLLPGCSFFLGVRQAPARRLIERGVPVLLATDYNPGSSMVESLPLIGSIACTQMKMTPMEAFVGMTINAAASLGRSDSIGCIAKGLWADLLILDVPSIDRWLYEVARPSVTRVLKRGRTAFARSTGSDPDAAAVDS